MQEAFVAALAHWTQVGVPDNPPAWITTTARRKLIDAARHERTQRRHQGSLQYETETLARGGSLEDARQARPCPTIACA